MVAVCVFACTRMSRQSMHVTLLKLVIASNTMCSVGRSNEVSVPLFADQSPSNDEAAVVPRELRAVEGLQHLDLLLDVVQIILCGF